MSKLADVIIIEIIFHLYIIISIMIITQKQRQKHKEKQPLPLAHNKRNIRADLYKNILTWQTYTAISNCSDTIIVIDESVRRKLGKIHFLELILQITSKQMNWHVDIIPTGTSDNDIIKVFNSYVNIPAIILTSDKDLHRKLIGHSIFVKTKKGRNAVRIIIESLKHRISRL